MPPVKSFVVISGLPGSGKTTLARRLAPMLDLPVIDKDDILEGLFEERGTGDAVWRRALSRESDSILRDRAMASDGAILVSFWHVRGMPADSGTPTDWLRLLSSHIVNVHCICDVEIAAERFLQRKRHAGHLDDGRSLSEVVTSLRQLPRDRRFDVGVRIDVETTGEPDPVSVALRVRAAQRHRDATG